MADELLAQQISQVSDNPTLYDDMPVDEAVEEVKLKFLLTVGKSAPPNSPSAIWRDDVDLAL